MSLLETSYVCGQNEDNFLTPSSFFDDLRVQFLISKAAKFEQALYSLNVARCVDSMHGQFDFNLRCGYSNDTTKTCQFIQCNAFPEQRPNSFITSDTSHVLVVTCLNKGLSDFLYY